MKKINLFIIAFISLMVLAVPARAQEDESDSTGMPGDHFSLRGALDIFKKAGSPEEFEKLLNTESNHVNNLDLDGDNEIDYVRVISKQDDEVHIFILQVAVSEKEYQDIAVIELEKNGKESATIQIIGDEEIFGEETIIEPSEEEITENNTPGGTFAKGPYASESGPLDAGAIVNVWFWPSVRFVYAPGYRAWVSPWRFRYYPAWWRPWRPLGWHVWHPYRGFYHRHYIVVRTHRLVRAHRVYAPFRATSVTIHNRHTMARKNYTVTRSRTTVVGPRGNSATRKTTTVRSANGRVLGSKTTIKKRRK